MFIYMCTQSHARTCTLISTSCDLRDQPLLELQAAQNSRNNSMIAQPAAESSQLNYAQHVSQGEGCTDCWDRLPQCMRLPARRPSGLSQSSQAIKWEKSNSGLTKAYNNVDALARGQQLWVGCVQVSLNAVGVLLLMLGGQRGCVQSVCTLH